MTSKNSLSERGLLRDCLRRNLWSVVLSVLGFFLSMVVPALMQMQNALEMQKDKTMQPEQLANWWGAAINAMHHTLGGANPAPKLVMAALAVVCGVALFSYLHSRQKVDFYHSLPISRTRLFATNFLTGVVCVLPAWVVMELITVACAYAMGFGAAVDWVSIGGALAGNLLFFVLLYALAALSAIVCGNTIISLLLLLWVYFAPAVARLLQASLFEKFFQTYAGSPAAMETAFKLSPVAQYFMMDGLQFAYNQTGSPAVLLAVYAAAALLAIALGCLLFRIRKSERAGTALAFEPAKVPVKAFMCVVGGVAVAMLFNTVGNRLWFWPGLVIGIVLFHWLIEIIYAFDFHAIFAKPAHLIAVLVVVLAGMQLLRLDVFGYNRWLPAEGDIAAANMAQYLDCTEPKLQTAENIVAARRLAEIGVGSRDTSGEQASLSPDAPEYGGYTLTFRMKNGRTVARYYSLPLVEEVNALLEQIYASEEYKRASWPLYTYDPGSYRTRTGEDTARIILYPNGPSYEPAAEILDPAQIDKVLETLRAEALTRPADAAPVMRLALGYDSDYDLWARGGARHTAYCGNAYVTEQDTRTLQLLEELTGVTPQPLTPEDVQGIRLTFWIHEERAVSIEVTDRADIEKCLENARNVDALSIYSDERREGAVVERSESVHPHPVAITEWDSYGLVYPVGKSPEGVFEKYRQQAEEQYADEMSDEKDTETVLPAVF